MLFFFWLHRFWFDDFTDLFVERLEGCFDFAEKIGFLLQDWNVERLECPAAKRKNFEKESCTKYRRFPIDFMFRLTEKEFESLMSQIATSKRGGRRKLPYIFTKHGVLMLSGALNS